MLDKWEVAPTHTRRQESRAVQLRNRYDLVSESGCGGRITFKYKDGSVITIKEITCKS